MYLLEDKKIWKYFKKFVGDSWNHEKILYLITYLIISIYVNYDQLNCEVTQNLGDEHNKRVTW